MKRASWLTFLAVIIFTLAAPGCVRHEQPHSAKLQVITTLFPVYDFARTIAGDKGEVSLLLPPGMEPHNYEPGPDDIVRIGKAGLFIYSSRYMEPWAGTILKGVDQRKLLVVDAGAGVTYLKSGTDSGHAGHDAAGDSGAMDPHIWLDLGNSGIMVANILAGFVAADPANAAYYKANAARLAARLEELDKRYQRVLAVCGTRVFLHGGHYTFGYLAHRYGLEYRSLSGLSSESEPSAGQMAAMAGKIKQSGVRYLFAEELLSPRLAETLAEETGAEVLKLHGAHNLGRDDFQRGVSFIEIMEGNLNNLQKGLACRER